MWISSQILLCCFFIQLLALKYDNSCWNMPCAVRARVCMLFTVHSAVPNAIQFSLSGERITMNDDAKESLGRRLTIDYVPEIIQQVKEREIDSIQLCMMLMNPCFRCREDVAAWLLLPPGYMGPLVIVVMVEIGSANFGSSFHWWSLGIWVSCSIHSGKTWSIDGWSNTEMVQKLLVSTSWSVTSTVFLNACK